jgi:CheY-like chemotaxis protein
LVHVRNGEKAVEICSQYGIKLVLYDLSMPVANDYQTINLIRKNTPEIGIIGQTAYSNYADEKKAMEAGCNDYLSKPIKSDLLLMRISQFVNHSKKQVNC